VLQSEYNLCLSPSRPLLPQSEYTFCLNPSRPYFRGEREGEYLFYRFTPTLSRKSVCGQLLIRSILFGPAIQFLCCPEKISKKSCSKKKIQWKRKKRSNNKKGLCVRFLFVSAVVLCDYLCVQARVSSTVKPRTSILPPLNDFSTCFIC
jgi:hypothetical protein